MAGLFRTSARFAAVAALLCTLSVSGAKAEEPLQIGLPVPNYGPYVPIYVARDLGLFKKNGVAVEISSYRGAAAAQEALAAGAANIIVSSPVQAAIAVKKGIAQKIIGVVATTASGWHIVVLKDSPIKTVKDLDGKSVAVTSAGGLTEYNLLWATKQAGVHAKAVPVGAAGLIPSLKAKQVDAASMHSPLPYQLILTGEGRSIFDVGKEMPPTVPDVWLAPQALIDKNPKAVEGVLRSFYEAVAYMKAHREESIAAIAKYTGDTDSKIAAVEYDVVVKDMPTEARIDPKWLQSSFDLASLGGARDFAPIDQVYSSQFAGVGAK